MLCHACQRQSNCLTHQLAEQDQNLHLMLEQLQGCQRRQPQHPNLSQKHNLQRAVQWMKKISRQLSP